MFYLPHLKKNRGNQNFLSFEFFFYKLLKLYLVENICYLNEEDVKIWNHSHHANYNIDNKKKKIKEYLVGRPELDIYSFDHLNTFF